MSAALAWTVGLLAAAGGGYALYRWHTPNGQLACPTEAALTAMIDRIRTGATSEIDAERLATSFDGAGCTTAAQALRTTIAAHRAAHAPGGVLGPLRVGPRPGGGDAFAIAPKEDVFDVYHLPNTPPDMLYTVVATLLAKPAAAWTDLDLNTLAPMLSKKILDAFRAQGTFVPGTPLAKVTVLNQLAAAAQAADAARGGAGAPDAALGSPSLGVTGDGGGSGGSASASASASFEGSGGFHL
jgi:hypothetical protein